MKRLTMSMIAAPAVIAGALAMAGPASASTADNHPVPVGVSQQFGQQFGRDVFSPRPEPVQFIVPREQFRFFCTRDDRREEFWLLTHRHELNRWQREELRFLESVCSFPRFDWQD
jgi:hypothetical protein